MVKPRPMIGKENIINYLDFRWFKFNLIFFGLLLGFYFLDDPLAGRDGATFVGYTYGVVATLGIILLMYLGIRKRAYASNLGILKGWVSAHIWIGLFLVLIVPLHSGFQFGTNVHSLAYGFMLATILSGVWGTYYYLQYPSEILSNRGGDSLKDLLTNIRTIESDLQQLEKGGSNQFLSLISSLNPPIETRFSRVIFASKRPQLISNQKIQELILELSTEEQEVCLKALGRGKEKIRLMNQFYGEIGAHYRLKIWLFFHLPLSFGLLITLGIHIFSVFYYL
jgi:hypothetical protein